MIFVDYFYFSHYIYKWQVYTSIFLFAQVDAYIAPFIAQRLSNR